MTARENKIKVCVVTSIVALGCLVMWQYIIPHFKTKSQVEQAAQFARSRDLVDSCFEDRIDWWGNPICVKRELAESGKAVAYIVVSYGRDGQADTEDDYQAIKIDLNKSKIIGDWAGQRAKRILEGFVDGARTPDKFEDKTGTDGSQREPDEEKDWKFWKKWM